ncbi:MAG: hypothetical protein K6E73_08915 [Bacteroidales bacterium]|nr:hypothetical protein [Bacteroidales bacterium]
MIKHFLISALCLVVFMSDVRCEEIGMKTWWFFGYERTTEAGIRADAKALKDAGFKGVVYYDQNHAKTRNGADLGFSQEWWNHLKCVARAASEHDLTFELNISNGYVAGGRWIDPAHAMQRVASADTIIAAKGRVAQSVALPVITGRDGFVRDIAVLAFPVGDTTRIRHFTAHYRPKGKGKTGAMQIPGPRGTFSGAKFEPLADIGTLQVSDDSVQWRDVLTISPMYAGQGCYPYRTNAVPATVGRYFRVDYHGDARLRAWSIGHEAKMDRWEEKSGLQSEFPEDDCTPHYATSEVLQPAEIVDLTDSVMADGSLRITLPEGRWRILRLAAVLTGAKSKHGRPELLGYECDKLSVEAAELHWNSYIQVILDTLRASGIDNVVGVTMDSHEGGSQNWTPLMLDEFRRRRGYDLRPYLPVLAGFVVESVEKSESVLRDYRRTISDCMTDCYYATFQRLAARDGLTFTAQAIGNALCIPGDAVAVKRVVDKPQGEFWAYQQTGAYDVKDCSSAAHLYGKPIASAEAMTDAEYHHTPLELKRVADIAFSFGAQEFVVCATPHIPEVEPTQPYVAGREYAINRSNPKWNELKPVWTALNRTMEWLRRGKVAPDVLVYLGDDVPVKTLTHLLPDGLADLDWDVCTGDALQTRLSPTADGQLTTPDSVHYRALIVEDGIYISPASRRKLDEFRATGVPVLTSAVGIEPWLSSADGNHAIVHTHRRDGESEIFFVANVSDTAQNVRLRLLRGFSDAQVCRTSTGGMERVEVSADGNCTISLDAGESVILIGRNLPKSR